MNKYLSIILAMVLVLCLVACNNVEPVASSSEPGSTVEGSSEIANPSEQTTTSGNNTISNNTTSKNNSSVVSTSSKPSSSSKPTTSNTTSTIPAVKPAAAKPDPDPNHAAPKAGDVYETNDYIYTYEWFLYELDSVYDPTVDYFTEGGWSVRAKENKANYEGIYEAIYGKPVISMKQAFTGFDKLEVSPEIPQYMKNMTDAYWKTSMTKAPTIPNGVTILFGTFRSTNITKGPAIPSSVMIMTYAFEGCKKLTTAPIIPESVNGLSYTFMNCESLTGTITINSTVNNIRFFGTNYAFDGTIKPIVLTGTTTKEALQKLAATSKAGNVTVQ